MEKIHLLLCKSNEIAQVCQWGNLIVSSSLKTTAESAAGRKFLYLEIVCSKRQQSRTYVKLNNSQMKKGTENLRPFYSCILFCYDKWVFILEFFCFSHQNVWKVGEMAESNKYVAKLKIHVLNDWWHNTYNRPNLTNCKIGWCMRLCFLRRAACMDNLYWTGNIVIKNK